MANRSKTLVFSITPVFAKSGSNASGIGAFNINLKSFIFQLVTFALVLYVFKRWILPPIQKTIEQRRQTLEHSLTQAKQIEDTLAKAEQKAEEMLAKARTQADESLAEAKTMASGMIGDAEKAAVARAERIIKESEAHLAQEREKLRLELRGELAGLVAAATEKVIYEKLDAKRDGSLIERAIRSLAG